MKKTRFGGFSSLKIRKIIHRKSSCAYTVTEGFNLYFYNNRTGGNIMAENRCQSRQNGVCIDCNQILDSCRDKDCFADTRVYLTEAGQEIINRTSNVRIKDTNVLWTYLGIEPVQFNRGFYQALVRFYTRITCETCSQNGRSQEFEGVAVCEKRVILFGSEGSVRIFRTEPGTDSFCPSMPEYDSATTNEPSVVCEVVDPIALSLEVRDCDCGCSSPTIPEGIMSFLGGNVVCEPSDGDKKLYVTLGFFSVIRLERPGQFIVNAQEYCVPDKVCCDMGNDDPYSAFERMSFPINEFCPLSPNEMRK